MVSVIKSARRRAINKQRNRLEGAATQMNGANVSPERQRLQEIGELAGELSREFAEVSQRVSAILLAAETHARSRGEARERAANEIEGVTANALGSDGEGPATRAGDRDIVALLGSAADAWERALHRIAVRAAARALPRDAATGKAPTITAFLVAKPVFPRTEVLEIRRGLSLDGGPGKLLALVDDRDAARAALQAILVTLSLAKTPQEAVNRTLAGTEGQSYLLEDREQLARAAAVMAGPVADAQEAAVAALRALEKLEAD